jgi:hypothetical protein
MIHLFFHELHPPSVKLDADLAFVFRVTFGNVGDPCAWPNSGDGAWRWARQLGLDCRLAQRLTAEQSQEALGDRVARELEACRQQMEAARLAREETRGRLVAAVKSIGIDIVWLREAALVASSSVSCLRNETDLDVLVQDSNLEKLTIALLNAGCSLRLRNRGTPRPPDATGRTAVFEGHRGAAVVLHRQLRFLRLVPGGASIDVACLRRCGLLLRDDVAQNKNIWVPSKAVQAAEWASQLLVEQRFAPEYSVLRALLDAQRLGLGDDEDLAFDAYLMLQTDVEHAEFEALRELMRALPSGEVFGHSKRARILLSHAIAAATVPSYQARLRLQHAAQRWQQHGPLERAAVKVGRALRRIKER